jgi:hypothetical protein
MNLKQVVIAALGIAALVGYFVASADQYRREISEPKCWAQMIADSDAAHAENFRRGTR